MPTTEMIFPEYIRLDGGTQPRATINPQVCDEYGERMKTGEKFPAIDVFFDGENYWLADGFHRVQAYVMAVPGEAIECNVFQGTLADAQWHSYSVNKAHGIRRKPEDKERAVKLALQHRDGAKKSDSEIAKHVGVDHKTVAKYRAKMSASWEIPKIDNRTVTRGKSTYQQDTAKIGRKGKKRRNEKPSSRMAARITQPTRTPNPIAKMTAINMPHDPFMGAMTLIEVFDVDYLRAVVNELSNHLKGLAQ